MKRIIQVLPEVAAVFRGMIEIVEVRGIALKASAEHEATLRYQHWVEAFDMEMTIFVEATFFSMTPGTAGILPPEEVGDESGKCHAACGLYFGVGDRKRPNYTTVDLIFDPHEHGGWYSHISSDIRDQRSLRHPLLRAARAFADHHGFKEQETTLSKADALALVAVLADAYPRDRSPLLDWERVWDQPKELNPARRKSR